MKLALAATAVLMLALAAACADDGTPEIVVVGVHESADAPERPDELPLIEGAVSTDGLKVILGTGDLGPGTNRFGFVLTTPTGFVTVPTVTVSSFLLSADGLSREARETAVATYHPWPYGARGLYTTPLDFNAPGRWAVEIGVESEDGSMRRADLEFEVVDPTFAPRVGDLAVSSDTRTVDDVERLSQLTTGSLQDRDLYRLTVAEAVSSGLPAVVVFASPAFCTNAVCGPQVEVLQQLKDEYGGRAQFVHVDFYDNPEEIQGDLTKAVISPAVREWRLPSIEWTFVIDRQGRVSARFEAFATYTEVEDALKKAL